MDQPAIFPDASRDRCTWLSLAAGQRRSWHAVVTQLVRSADATVVPLIHGARAEVHTRAIGEVEDQGEAARMSAWPSFSRMADASTFPDLRRSTGRSSAVTGGAGNFQSWIDWHRPDLSSGLPLRRLADQRSSRNAVSSGHHMVPDALARSLYLLKHRAALALSCAGWIG